MALYRGKYDLRGLDSLTPEMEKDLDLAYEICMSYRDIPCEMCGRCCHQPNIIVRPEEVERVASARICKRRAGSLVANTGVGRGI